METPYGTSQMDVKETELHKLGTDFSFKREIVWKNAIGFLALHLLAVYGLYLCFFAKAATIWWSKYLSDCNLFIRQNDFQIYLMDEYRTYIAVIYFQLFSL